MPEDSLGLQERRCVHDGICPVAADWGGGRATRHDRAGSHELGCAYGWLDLAATSSLAFWAVAPTPWSPTAFALGGVGYRSIALHTQSQVPEQFGARILTGALSGAALGAGGGALPGGLVAGIVGAVIGTLADVRSGRVWRRRLATIFRPR